MSNFEHLSLSNIRYDDSRLPAAFWLNRKGLGRNLLGLLFWGVILVLPGMDIKTDFDNMFIRVFHLGYALIFFTIAVLVVTRPHLFVGYKGIRFNIMKFSFPMDWDDIDGYELEKFDSSDNSPTYLAIYRHGRGVSPDIKINLDNLKEPEKLLEIIDSKVGERSRDFHFWGEPNQNEIVSQVSEPPPVAPVTYKGAVFSSSGIEHKGKLIHWGQVTSVLYPTLITIGGYGELIIRYSEDGIKYTIKFSAGSNRKYRDAALSIIHNAEDAYIEESLLDALKG